MENVPSFEDLMNPTIEALNALGGSGYVREIDNKIIEQLQIPDDISDIPHSENRGNQTRLANRLGWIRTYLKKYGVLENPKRGVWATVSGKQNTKVNPKDVVKYYEGKVMKHHNIDNSDPLNEEKDISIKTENESWQEELLRVLTETLTPSAFERLIQRVLRECGFVEVQVTGKSGDDGIDGIGIAKINDLMSFHVIFQCKRYGANNSITPENIRSFRGSMAGRTDKGLFITTSIFTKKAQEEATRDGVPPIDLIDGEQLIDKLKELKMGMKVETEIVEKITVDKSWYENI